MDIATSLTRSPSSARLLRNQRRGRTAPVGRVAIAVARVVGEGRGIGHVEVRLLRLLLGLCGRRLHDAAATLVVGPCVGAGRGGGCQGGEELETVGAGREVARRQFCKGRIGELRGDANEDAGVGATQFVHQQDVNLSIIVTVVISLHLSARAPHPSHARFTYQIARRLEVLVEEGCLWRLAAVDGHFAEVQADIWCADCVVVVLVVIVVIIGRVLHVGVAGRGNLKAHFCAVLIGIDLKGVVRNGVRLNKRQHSFC